MVCVKKREHGIQVQVKDSKTKFSKSFTIHGTNTLDFFYKLLSYANQLTKHGDNLRLVCYKKNKEDMKNG